jgi:broad specificity phosphatase PhoE
VPVVLLIRHAQASFGTANYDSLSGRGLAQVHVLHRALKRRGIVADRIVSGSLQRQRDTARPWTDAVGAATTIDDRWNEYDDDDVLSHHSSSHLRLARTAADVAPSPSSREFQLVLDQALQGWVDAGASGAAARTWPRFLGDVNGALDGLASGLGDSGTGLVFTSSGVIAALAASLIGLPDRAFVPFNRVSVNTSITKVIVGSRGKTLISYNDHSHLEDAGDHLVTYR